MLLLFEAVPHIVTTSAPGQRPPEILFLDQPFNWLPATLAFSQFLVLAALTYYIFRRNSAQKIRERRADWYHELVVDRAVSMLVEFIDRSCDSLRSSARQVQVLKRSDALSSEVDEYIIGKALKDFKDELRRTRRYVCAQAGVFDKQLDKQIFDRFMRLEDDVTAWFNREAQAEADEGRTPLAELLIACETEIINSLISFEFSTWG